MQSGMASNAKDNEIVSRWTLQRGVRNRRGKTSVGARHRFHETGVFKGTVLVGAG